jgi:hypothetical protein
VTSEAKEFFDEFYMGENHSTSRNKSQPIQTWEINFQLTHDTTSWRI